MALEETEEKCFSFLWKVKNISFCLQKKGEQIASPAFVVDVIEKKKWKLFLYPRGSRDGNCIGFFLNREADSKGPAKVDIKYELSFIAKDGSVLTFKDITTDAFPKGQGMGYDTFQKREDIYVSKRSTFMPENILRVRCRMWKVVGQITKNVLCTAYTRIGVEKTSFLWNVNNFSTLESEKKLTYQVKSIADEAPVMSIDLSLTGGLSSGEIIRFETTLQDLRMKFSTLRLSLIDSSGNKVECNEDEFWFNSLQKCKQFALFFTKKKLLAKKGIYLPDDVLSLNWEWVFSKGVVLEEIEEVQYGSTNYENNSSDDRNLNNEQEVPLSPTLNESLKSLYDMQFLCDVKLKTDASVFPAHKIILSASSTVFNTMFSSDMKEKYSDCVNIDDLSDDAVRRMLLYIYSGRMDDLTWENASKLYLAADKYAILNLKNICSSFLKNNLSPEKACDVLLLADLHSDDDLKSSVQHYILKHDMDIINSDRWKALMDINGKLAAETLCLRYK